MNENEEENNNIEVTPVEETKEVGEEAQYFVLSMFGENCSVDYAIDMEKTKKEIAKESFKIINKNIRNIYVFACTQKARLNFLILQAHILKVYSAIMQNISLEYHDDAIESIRKAKEELTKLNHLVVLTKKALMRLKRANTVFCNIEISDLLKLIYEKEELILDELEEHLKMRELEIKGIRYYGTNKNQKQIAETTQQIDESVKVLGLNKKTLSDK